MKPKLFAELRPGARVVSHDWDMGRDWPPDEYVKLGNDGIYLWIMPEHSARKALPQTARRHLRRRSSSNTTAPLIITASAT